MKSPHPPALGHSRILVIRREGGLAHFPGLSAPRQIDCGECSEGQRRWLERVLRQAAQYDAGETPGADRRAFHVDVEEAAYLHQPEVARRHIWSLILAEEHTPSELVALWKHGELGEDV